MKLTTCIFSVFASLALPTYYTHAQCFSGNLSFGGSTIFDPVVKTWATDYAVKCKKAVITSNATGARGGVNGACQGPGFAPVDVANLSRDWRNSEATTTDGVKFKCVIGNTSREVIQLPVALDGIVLFVKKNGKLWNDCLSKISGSLTSDNIRWLFTNRTDIDQPSNSDGNAATRRWSEISAQCPTQESLVAGPGPQYGTSDFFREILFLKPPEGYRSDYQNYDVTSTGLIDFVSTNDYGIAYAAYAFFNANSDKLEAIKVDGVYPTETTLGNDQYVPFGRRIFSNVVTNPDILAKAKCLYDFVFSSAGVAGLEKIGFLPIPKNEWKIVNDRLPGKCPTPTPKPTPCTLIQRLLRRCK